MSPKPHFTVPYTQQPEEYTQYLYKKNESFVETFWMQYSYAQEEDVQRNMYTPDHIASSFWALF